MLTLPNILTGVRLLLIPVIVWLYCGRREYAAAAGMVAFSWLTDVADGFLARHFHMGSDLGKILDPIADKLTQAVTLFCLGARYPAMLVLAVLLAVKELVTGIHSLKVVRQTQTVKSSDWHGKLTTGLLYLTMAVHILWIEVPSAVTAVLTALCLGMMALSFVLYLRRNIRQLRDARGKEN